MTAALYAPQEERVVSVSEAIDSITSAWGVPEEIRMKARAIAGRRARQLHLAFPLLSAATTGQLVVRYLTLPTGYKPQAGRDSIWPQIESAIGPLLV